MPFSSDGDTIDFIYGVINWKTVDAAGELVADVDPEIETTPEPQAVDEEVLLLEEESAAVAEQFEPVEPVADATVAWEEDTFEAAEPEPPNHNLLSLKWRSTISRNRTMKSFHESHSPGNRMRSPKRLLTKFRSSCSTRMPVLPTACGPRARPRSAVKAGDGRTRAALYRALSLAYDFARRRAAGSGRLCRASRGIGREGAGPRADDPDRQARLRHRL